MWDDCSFDDGTKQLGAFFESKGFEAAANGVEEDVAGCFELRQVKSQFWACQAGLE